MTHEEKKQIFSYWIDQTGNVGTKLFRQWAHYVRLIESQEEPDFFPERFIAAYNYALETAGYPEIIYEIQDMEIAPHALAREFYCLGECGRPGRYFFSDGDTEDDAVYIHLTTPDNQVARDQLEFKDILLACPEVRAEYAALKQQLAEQYPYSRATYRLLKGEFIEKCLEEGYDVLGD